MSFSAATPLPQQDARREPKTEDLLANLRRAVQQKPADAQAHLSLGLALAGQGSMLEAECFRRVVELQPASAEAHLNLGIALADGGDVAGALAEFREAVKLAPRSAAAHYNMGRALHDLGQVEAARQELEEAIALDAHFAPALQMLAQIERDRKNLERSGELLRRAVRLDPGDAKAHFMLGENLADLSRVEEAVREWEKAVEIDPTYRRALYRLSQALRATNPEKARQYSQRFLKLRRQQQISDRAGTLGDGALVLAQAGKFPEAIAQLKEAIKICGDCAAQGLLRKNLGLIYGKSGDYGNAEKELRAAEKLLPNDRDIRTALDFLEKTGAAAAAGKP